MTEFILSGGPEQLTPKDLSYVTISQIKVARMRKELIDECAVALLSCYPMEVWTSLLSCVKGVRKLRPSVRQYVHLRTIVSSVSNILITPAFHLVWGPNAFDYSRIRCKKDEFIEYVAYVDGIPLEVYATYEFSELSVVWFSMLEEDKHDILNAAWAILMAEFEQYVKRVP